MTDIPKNTRAEGYFVQRLSISAKCGFRFRTAYQIIPSLRFGPLVCSPNYFPQGKHLIYTFWHYLPHILKILPKESAAYGVKHYLLEKAEDGLVALGRDTQRDGGQLLPGLQG